MVYILKSNSFTVRSAKIADIELLAEIGRKAFDESFSRYNNPDDMNNYLAAAFSPSKQASEFASPGCLFLIAEENGVPIGYARLQAGRGGETCITGDKPVELVRIYILEKWIGKGHGGNLLLACLDSARAQGYDSIWLGVWEKNDRAIRFYERWGFRKVGTHQFLLGNDLQNDYLMERTL